MSLTSIPSGPATQRPVAEAALAATKELQGLKSFLLAGAAANADIAMVGAKTTDTLVFVIEHDGAGVVNDRTSVSTISGAGVLHVNAVTTGKKLHVLAVIKP